MLAPYLPYPPHAGGRIRMLELLRFLRPRHKITVVAFIFSETELPLVEQLSANCERVISVARHKEPLSQDDLRPRLIAEFCTTEMQNCLQALNSENQFDMVDVEHIFMAQYSPLVAAPGVLQEHNIESEVLRRYAEATSVRGERMTPNPMGAFRDASQEWAKMAAYESLTWPQFPVRVTVSEFDRTEMLKRCPMGRVVTVPNGVNTTGLRPLAPTGSHGVLFTGTLDYQPNLDAAFELCDSLWPLVVRRVPDACLYIVGRKPPADLLARKQPGRVEIVADAPDIVPYATRCSVSAVPLRSGGGTRIKILTALALGIPVVTTTVGYEGLELEPGRDLLVADEPTHFAEELVHLLLDGHIRTSLARAGRAAVEARYDWQQVLPTLERVYEEVVGS